MVRICPQPPCVTIHIILTGLLITPWNSVSLYKDALNLIGIDSIWEIGIGCINPTIPGKLPAT
jgi:hypothetical protein